MKKSEEKKTKTENLENLSPHRHRGRYARTKGHRYEQQIVNELKELGFNGCKTSRYVSKMKDDQKIDIVDLNNQLPAEIQAKKTINIPNYFKIREESGADPSKFCIFWAKQEPREKNIITVGEVAIIPKEFFYELIKPYANE